MRPRASSRERRNDGRLRLEGGGRQAGRSRAVAAPRRSARSSFWKLPFGRRVAPYLFIAPSALIFLLFIVWPAAQGLFESLFTRGIIVDPVYPTLRMTFVGLGNYLALLSDSHFLDSLGRTLVYTVVGVPLTMAVSLGLALLVQPRYAGVGVVRAIVYWPSMVSLIIIGIAWKWILAYDSGVLNYLLGLLGEPKIPWLLSPAMAIGTVIAVSVWATCGFFMVIYLAGLNAIPDQYYEAADIDGATRIQRFWCITVPLLRPTTLLVLVLCSINSLKVFQQVVALTAGGPGRATVFMVQNMYEVAFTQPDSIGFASAQSVVLFVTMLLFTLLQLRIAGREDAY